MLRKTQIGLTNSATPIRSYALTKDKAIRTSLATQIAARFKSLKTSTQVYSHDLKRFVFTSGFAFLFVYFAYNLCFVAEESRVSNELCRWGLFISGLFAFLSALITRELARTQQATAQTKVKTNRAYTKDKELLSM